MNSPEKEQWKKTAEKMSKHKSNKNKSNQNNQNNQAKNDAQEIKETDVQSLDSLETLEPLQMNVDEKQGGSWFFPAFIAFDIIAIGLIVCYFLGVFSPKEVEPEYVEVSFHQTTVETSDTMLDQLAQVFETERKEACQERFEHAMFLGDSLTEGLGIYGYVKEKNVLAIKGLNLLTAKDYIKKIAKKQPKYVFVMLGINDLNCESFSMDYNEKNYRKLIEKIHKKSPDTKVYVESLLPVTSGFQKEHKQLSNKRIVKFNERLAKLSTDYDYTTYVDIHSLYVNDKGNLPKKISADGYHLFSSAYEPWIDYIKNDME